LILLCALTACDRGPQGPAAAGSGARRYTVAVVPKGATHHFWKSIHAGALKAADELGNVDILWKSGLKEDDRDAQIKVVEDMIARRVDGIVLAPLDDTALRPAVHEAVRQGIPVVIVDSDLKSDQHTSFIATDNYAGGTKAGALVAELLGGRGRIAMLRYAEGSASTMQREQGFLDAVRKHPGLELVSANQYGGATTETAYKASENLLAPLRGPDGKLTIRAVFCPNESTTFGMLRALRDLRAAGQVTFVGFDSSELMVKALANRELNGTILQDPMKMGYLGVRSVVAKLKGQPVERRVDTGSTVARPDNMNEPAVRALLEPDLARWLKE
jgi:ribose transport system substrate-binding protein